MITLTEELLKQLRTDNGGFTRSTTDALGVGWPLQSGWLASQVGRSISDKAWKEALAGRSLGMERRFQGNTRSRRRSS